MCLCLDFSIHTNKINLSLVAARDILVYKVLSLNPSFKTAGFSPYYGFKWVFGEKYTANMRNSCSNKNYMVNRGLHASTKYAAAYMHIGCDTDKIFPAVIPKGSRLFFGKSYDIVASEMIVYRDREAVEAVHGKISRSVPKLKLVC